MLLVMMLDKICNSLIGVFFFLVILQCCGVVGQVLMTVKFSAFSFDFLQPVVIVCRMVFVMLMMLLQWLSCVWQTISDNNVFLCGGIVDKNLGLNVSVESFDKGGKSSSVKTVVALYLLVFIGIVRLECLMALMMILLSFLFPSSTRCRQSL